MKQKEKMQPRRHPRPQGRPASRTLESQPDAPAQPRAASLLLLLGLISFALAGCVAVSRKGLDKTTQVPGRAPAITLVSPAPTPEPLRHREQTGLTNSRNAVEFTVPGSRPSRHEELWIIAAAVPAAKPDPNARPEPSEPDSGALCARVGEELVPLPLKHTDVKADIAGYIAAVKLRQQFHNPYPGKIEAIYVFPLPENAAIHEFVMTIGERHIRGIIREREEAEQIYHEARRQGYTASLLTQERPNLFTQSIANIEPGQGIDVTLQ